MDAPFSIDPAATAAFSRLREQVGEAALHDTAAPVKAVVIGGGTGAPVSIRTLLSLEADVTAVVSMADDGGSTGILREQAGVLPPGDVRKCLAAMASDDDDPLTLAFKCRFAFASNHTLGNLMLSALEEVTGSFPEAISVCARLLGARGRVLPSTLTPVRLCSLTCDGTRLVGQAAATNAPSALARAWLEADGAIAPYEPALDAIRQADLVVLGPGSLFTSIIPNLLVPGVADAVRESRAAVLFVCSLADMQGETRGMSALAHFEALERHGLSGRIDYMLVHSPRALRPGDSAPPDEARLAPDGATPIRPVRISYDDAAAVQERGCVVLVRDLAGPERPTWHDPAALRGAMRAVIRLSRSQMPASRAREVASHAADAVGVRTFAPPALAASPR